MISLTAEARYGYDGKQYIARITGRDQKFTFSREFVGQKSGKRGGDSSYDTDTPGLYLTCDVDAKGKHESYVLVYELDGGLRKFEIDKDDAMTIAKRLDGGSVDWTREALRVRLAVAEGRDQNADVKIGTPQLGLAAGTMKRSELVAALRRAVDGDSGTDPKAAAVARVRALMAEVGVTVADLTEEAR